MAFAIFCNTCRSRFEGSDRFCAACGAKRHRITSPVAPDPSSVSTAEPGYGPVGAVAAEPVVEAINPFLDYYPADWSASGFILTNGSGEIAINVTSKADAKAALKDLRLRKRQLVDDRKVTRMELAGVKRQHSGAGRGRSALPRGGGDFGKMVRAFETLGRQWSGSRRDRAVDAVQERVDEHDHRVAAIDGLILRLEQDMIAAEQRR